MNPTPQSQPPRSAPPAGTVPQHAARSTQHASHAFTLIEIMVSIMVFSLVIASIYATWALVMRATQVGKDCTEQAQRQRVVLRTIGDAIMGVESFQASLDKGLYSFELANGEAPYLSFVAHLPETYPRNGKFVGETSGHETQSRRVIFSLAPGADGKRDLVLRQKPILMDLDQDEQQFPLVLARNVKQFTVEWWGTNSMNEVAWNTDWDDTQTNTIPQMLRVHLVMSLNTGKDKQDESEFSATRIYAVPSQMMPVFVQRGAGGGPGGPGGPGGVAGLLVPPSH